MLPRTHRLRHRRDFKRVYREGLRQNSSHLTLRALKVSVDQLDTNSGQESYLSGKSQALVSPRGQTIEASHNTGDRSPVQSGRSVDQGSSRESSTQIGISISTKVSKRSTIRNRIKRQIKAAMYHLLPMIASNWLIVISVRPKAIECDYWQFLRELEEMIKNLR